MILKESEKELHRGRISNTSQKFATQTLGVIGI